MKLTFAGSTALAILRALRARRRPLPARTKLRDPDPAPYQRWTKGTLRSLGTELSWAPLEVGSLVVCVGSKGARLRTQGVRNIIHAGTIPVGSFFDLGNGFCSSSPELLFVEMAAELSLPQTVMLGFELCGRYSLDARDPEGGDAKMELEPVTTVGRLGRYLQHARELRGMGRARQALHYIADEAWSPMEAVVAAMMMLPLEEYGYGFGRCTLNLRIDTREQAIGPGDKAERVPDILLDGAPVGINYDGAYHLDLGSIVAAAVELGRHPENSQAEAFTNRVVAQVRSQAVDDIRRDRALAASGLTVYSVVKEDLYERGALDGVMWQVVLAIEAAGGEVDPRLRIALRSKFAQDERYRLLMSLLPGRGAPEAANPKAVEAFVRLPNHAKARSIK